MYVLVNQVYRWKTCWHECENAVYSLSTDSCAVDAATATTLSGHFRCGSQWKILHRRVLEQLMLHDVETDTFTAVYRFFRTTLIPDERFLHTLFQRLDYYNTFEIDSYDAVFVDWARDPVKLKIASETARQKQVAYNFVRKVYTVAQAREIAKFTNVQYTKLA